MYIKYFFDLKKGDYIIYDKNYGTLIQIYENQISYDQIISLLQFSKVVTSTITSIKVYSPEMKGFIEVSKLFPLEVNDFSDKDGIITLILKTEEENIQEKCQVTLKELMKMTSNFKKIMIKPPTTNTKEISCSNKTEGINSNKITFCYMFSKPLVGIENNKIVPFSIKSNYDFEINIIRSLIKNNENKLNCKIDVLNEKSIVEVINQKPNILFINSYGNYCDSVDLSKRSLFIENSHGTVHLLHTNQLNASDFKNTDLVILSNCHLCIGEELFNLGVKNIITIQSFNDNAKTPSEDDMIFIKFLLKEILIGKTIKQSYDIAKAKVIEHYQKDCKNMINSKLCVYHLHNQKCPLLESLIKKDFKKVLQYVHNENHCCCLSKDQKENATYNPDCLKYVFFTQKEGNDKALFQKEYLNVSKLTNSEKDVQMALGKNTKINSLLYKIINNVGRIKILCNCYHTGKLPFIKYLGKYYIERKIVNPPIISICISYREITEMLIANRISVALKYPKWNNLLEFYNLFKNEKLLVVIYLNDIVNTNYGQFQSVFDNFTENTLIPTFIISILFKDEKDIVKVTFPIFKYEGLESEEIINVIKEEITDTQISSNILSNQDMMNSIFKYVRGRSNQIVKICFLSNLLKNEKMIKEGMENNNLLEKYLNYIEEIEGKDIFSKKEAINILFSLSYCIHGLEMQQIQIFAINPNKQLDERLIDILRKYKLIYKGKRNNVHITSIFVEEIINQYKNEYLEQFIINLIHYAKNAFSRIMNIQYYDGQMPIDILTEFSGLYPVLIGFQNINYFSKKNFKNFTQTNFQYYYSPILKNENIVSFLFLGNRNLLNKILKKKGGSKIKNDIEKLSIFIPSFYKYLNIYESLFWTDYFLELLLANKMTATFQKLLLFKYSIKKDNTNISLLEKNSNGSGIIELIFNYCYIISGCFDEPDKTEEVKEKTFNKIRELLPQIQAQKEGELELIVNTFLFKLCIQSKNLNIYVKNVLPLLTNAKDIRLKYEILLLKLEWYLLIYNDQEAQEIINEINELGIPLSFFKSFRDRYEILLNKLHKLKKSKYYNQICILHSSSTNKKKDNQDINLSTRIINKFQNLQKYKKEISYLYLPLTLQNLEITFNKYGKILIIISEDVDKNLCLEDENKERKAISFNEFNKHFSTYSIHFDIVILLFSTNNFDNYVNFFINKNVENVIYPKLSFQDLANAFIKVKMSLDMKLIFLHFALFILKFLKKILLGFEVKESYESARNKIYSKINEICPIAPHFLSFEINM